MFLNLTSRVPSSHSLHCMMHAYIMPQRPETLDPLLYAAWVLVRAGRPPEGISQNSVSLSGSLPLSLQPVPSPRLRGSELAGDRIWQSHLQYSIYLIT